MRPSRIAQLLVPALFLAGVAGAWGWFRLAPEPTSEFLRFQFSPAIPGWMFTPEKVSPNAEAILATTNLLNGSFTSATGERVMVFAAEWRAEDSRSMSVVQHTPDICWVGGGWLPVESGQPPRVEVELGGKRTPFECRVFAVPGGGRRELVIWCTLVGGAVLEEGSRWVSEENVGMGNRERQASAGRRLAVNQLLRNIAARRIAVGEKQFVRLSAPLTGDWQSTLDHLQQFASLWLVVDRRP